MSKWHLLTGTCSLALLGWGIFAFIEYNESVGANGDSLSGWILCGLGLTGLATLRWSQVGYAAAVAHLAATAFAAWWCVIAFALWRTAAVSNLGFIGPLILSFAIPMLLLCGVNVAGTWQVARGTMRCGGAGRATNIETKHGHGPPGDLGR